MNRRIIKIPKFEQDLAIACTSRSEFARKYPALYVKASKQKYLSRLLRHLPKRIDQVTKIEAQAVAKRYKSRKEFKVNCRRQYEAALKRGWLDEICSHMRVIQPGWSKRNQWSEKANVAREAKRYSTRAQFARGSNGAYTLARKKDWLDEVCEHMHCLLYTSPSPRDKRQSRMPSSA